MRSSHHLGTYFDQLYAESLARFQGGSPYIYPLYGLGELPQVSFSFLVVTVSDDEFYYDPTTHFESTVQDVISMYKKITGKELDLSVDLSAASAAGEDA
ncbi:hypothetical protein BHE74_00008497 [Ensete ventricosum]|uniref:Uncharacterized protein n=1 Tax=Ensete ventricosum TaxID=4639 RepID=A0A427B3H4_ENSVE|nr:hypothetical protein B296_00018736 [Ensete ventricosum]RWW34553.1 hypothetical protein GW17_00000700 [Ensete ventricosum]RWW83018.1 hypothetical protein BHE74_00008497 [Ensete ventricosum]RZR76365.1 hypothetical protein BHM03_00001137 [Ensete ventricosum]